MNLSKIEKILQDDAGLRVCPICGNPYKPYHRRQRTCGEQDCKREYHNEQMKARQAREMAENPEEFRANKRKHARRYAKKQSALRAREAQLRDLSERWEKQSEFDRKVSEYGLNYGQVQAEKTLAQVPKIDVTIGDKEDDNKSNQDNR